MPRKEKIDNLKASLGIKDSSIAEKYLIRSNWNVEEAMKLYSGENPDYSERATRNEQETHKIIEFKINEKLKSSDETFLPKNKDLYNDFIKFLKDKNSYVVSNFKDFLCSLERRGGLIIIFPEEKMNEVRNNMIRASNIKFCSDIMTKATIFPILKDSEIANEFIKVFSIKNFPFYTFCKYKNEEKMEIKSSIAKKFWMKDVVDTLLNCFPETDIKESIYKNITETLIIEGEKISKIESNEFTGDIQEQNSTISNLIKLLNNEITNDIQHNNSFLNIILDERKMIKKINFQETKPNQSNVETTVISNDDSKFCKIKFKYPNGEKFIEKEFLKTEKVISLFNFVESLGRDIYTNQSFNSFELIHDFPPKTLSEVKNNTLIKQGLFPASIG